MAVSTREPVRSDWTVSQVLAHYPELLQVLIDLSPAFKHLRNPLARTLRTRLVSVAQAARVAGMCERRFKTGTAVEIKLVQESAA